MDREEFIAEVKALELDPEQYIVVGSGILAVLNIRDARDVDIVVSESLYEELEQSGWERTDKDNGGYYILSSGPSEAFISWGFPNGRPNLRELKAEEIVIERVPFVGLQRVLEWKKRKGRPKDLGDIELIEEYLK